MLVERDVQLSQLGEALDSAIRGRGSLVLISGEAGIGKTSLIEAFLADQDDRARTLWGACDDLATPRPLGPFHDIARHVGGELASSVKSDDSSAVMHAFLDEIERSSRPTIAVIEDVHWADQASFDVLRFVGRRLDRSRATVVVSYRDDAVAPDHPLRQVVGVLPTTTVRRIELQPLSVEGVEQLAQGDSARAQELMETTGGNPFFVTEAMDADPGTIPLTIRDAVMARVARLSDEARSLAELVSVIPARAENWLIAGSMPEADGSLAECEDAGVLIVSSDAAWFRHELARRAVESSLPEWRRRELNREVLRILETQQADPSRLVHHAEQSGDAGATLRWALVAARQAAKANAHREASVHFERALPALETLPDEDQAAALEEFAVECYLTDQADAAMEAGERALNLRREIGDQRAIGRLLRLKSRLHWWKGHRAEAEETAEAAIAALSKLPPSDDLAMAYSNRAQLAMLSQHNQQAIDWGNRAIELATEVGADEPLAHALNNVGSALWRSGRSTEGEKLLRRSLELALAEGLDEHACRAFTNLAWFRLERHQYDDASRMLKDGLAYSRETDNTGFETYLLGTRARLRLETGDWRGAEADADAALGRPEDVRISLIPALEVKGLLQVRRGDPAAQQAVDETWEQARPSEEIQRIGPTVAARAELAWYLDDLQAVRDDLTAAYQRRVNSATSGSSGRWPSGRGGPA